MARILVVEDDKDLLFLYQAQLTRQGHEITVCEKTAEALMYLAHDEFDIIVLDMNMPDEPGLAVIEFVNGDPRLHHIEIIVISAGGQYRAACAQLGVDQYLVKPVPMRQLFALIDEVLQV